MTERSNGGEDKRRLILDAAVRVSARRGFHTCRIAPVDIDGPVQPVDETPEPARERLAGVAEILLRAWRRDRDLVRVVVREIVCGGLAADRATVPV